MDVERTIEFILQERARTEAIMQRTGERVDQLAEAQRRSGEGLDQLEATQTQLAENLITLADIVRQFAEQNQREHQKFEEFHRGVDERFNVLIKMMDEWISEQRNRNGGP